MKIDTWTQSPRAPHATTKQCDYVDGDGYCCRLDINHEGDHTRPRGDISDDLSELKALHLAIANATNAFKARDPRALATINEAVQPVADAALEWIFWQQDQIDRLRRENAEAWRAAGNPNGRGTP
jgi:hypothetical protein